MHILLNKSPIYFFCCMWMFSYSSPICWKDYFSPLDGLRTFVKTQLMVFYDHRIQSNICGFMIYDHRHMGLPLYFQPYSTHLYVCWANTTPSWLPLLCVVSFEIRNKGPLLRSFARSCWLFWVSYHPIWVLETAWEFLIKKAAGIPMEIALNL